MLTKGWIWSVRMKPITKYTKIAVLLHWLISLLILCNVALGLGSGYVPDADVRPMIDLHKSIGITVLALAFVRFFWRFTHTPPALPADYPTWERQGGPAGRVAACIPVF